jgi:aldose sugar dehydrogenase
MKIIITVSGIVLVFAMFIIIGFIPKKDEAQPKASSPRENFERYCAGCHGMNMERFAGRTYQSGTSTDHLANAIKYGLPTLGMPAFEKTFSDTEIEQIANYLVSELKKAPAVPSTPVFPPIIKGQHFNYRLDTVVTGLDAPWTILFLPDGDMLVTERSGQLFRYRNNKLAAIIEGVPPVFFKGQGGLFDLVLHPDYAKNAWIYISYAQLSPDNSSEGNTAVFRARLKNDKLIDQQEVFKAQPYSNRGHHFGGRMVFDDEKKLYITIGDRGKQTDAQLLTNHSGKVHRINDDGTIPTDNPFVKTPNAVASIYSYGHRNQQGIDIHPTTKQIWTNEHGPKGGDEINRTEKGKNYGWPEITYGINYNGTPITAYTAKDGMEQPIHQWTPSIAPSSMIFVTGNKYPQWQGDILSGSLSFKYLERTRIVDGKTVETEKLLDGIGRLRDVTIGPDGYIYVAVEKPGGIFRLIPLPDDKGKGK